MTGRLQPVTAEAWCRVDLAGGTLDIWPLGLLHDGASTVNVAIDVKVRARIQPTPTAPRYSVSQGETRLTAASPAELAAQPEGALVGLMAAALELPPFEATLESDSPRGGGLGASSAMTVALLSAAEAAFDLPPREPERIAYLARDLEAQLMRLPTGIQDHFAALFGGAQAVRHRPGGEKRQPLDVDLSALADSLLVAYTGQSHFSAGQNWHVVRARLDGEPLVTALLAEIAEVASLTEDELVRGRLAAVGACMAREWRLRRRLAEGISTPEIETLLDVAAAEGAWGGKACGAGGGGCIALLCPPPRRPLIAHRIAAAGGRIVPARPAAQPMSLMRL